MKKTNLADVRVQNAHIILHELELHDATTNTDIAMAHHLSIPTVTKIINVLNQNALVRYLGENQSSGGRRAKRIGLNPDYHYFVGLSITKHIVSAAVINFSGAIIHSDNIYCQFEDTPAYWESIRNFAASVTTDLKHPFSYGLTIDGICDFDNNQILDLQNLGICTLPISQIRNNLQFDFSINNASRLAGFAQLYGKDQFANSVFVALNRRISGSLILNNDIFSLNQFDCSFGNMVISTGSDDTSYGPAGSVASFCSASRIIDTLREEGIPDTYDEFFSSLQNGNTRYQKMWDEYLDCLAATIHNIHAVFGLKVIVGGEMANYLPPYYNNLCSRIDRWSSFVPASAYLFFSEHGRYDAAVGAALLARKDYIIAQLPDILQRQNEEV